MDNNAIFNLAVCVLGVCILLIHIVDLIIKENKRKDEKNLLAFLVFTAFHFATYLTFIIVKIYYNSDALITASYTIFYIMNNIELLLLFIYTVSYISLSDKTRKIMFIINLSLFLVFFVLDIVNIFNKMFFYSEGGIYYRTRWMTFSQLYQFIGFAMVFVLTIFNKKLDFTSKIAFLSYCLIPFIGIVVQNLVPGYAIGYLAILVSIEVLYLFVNMKKNTILLMEEKRNKEAEIKIMMSQIQPHFIYNTLASISTLIKLDPDKAQQGLDDFTEYLRTNLSLINENNLISFADELKHIETYIALEKMRFGDRLNIKYDITVKDFFLPPLTIQPIVENAIKHGILKQIKGGTVEIKTLEIGNAYIIEINDDGVGFNSNEIPNFDSSHIGISNVKYRLMTLCNGEMEITSELEKGTSVVITIYK